MSPAPRGPLRIEAWIEAARAPVTTAEPLANAAIEKLKFTDCRFFSFKEEADAYAVILIETAAFIVSINLTSK